MVRSSKCRVNFGGRRLHLGWRSCRKNYCSSIKQKLWTGLPCVEIDDTPGRAKAANMLERPLDQIYGRVAGIEQDVGIPGESCPVSNLHEARLQQVSSLEGNGSMFTRDTKQQNGDSAETFSRDEDADKAPNMHPTDQQKGRRHPATLRRSSRRKQHCRGNTPTKYTNPTLKYSQRLTSCGSGTTRSFQRIFASCEKRFYFATKTISSLHPQALMAALMHATPPIPMKGSTRSLIDKEKRAAVDLLYVKSRPEQTRR